MRFRSLHFIRYGSLTDRPIPFRPDARLHVVYGRNEAGKSSALSATADLLFGFAKQKQFDFLHEASRLRVGAELVNRDGASLRFRRRRGNKNTLLSDSADEAALHDDALAPFLGSLSRETFRRAFGLDSARLRQGATEMLRSEGELGGMLFAAASGLLGLSSLRAQLEDEADTLFGKRASENRLFYQIQARHELARRLERDSELRSADWKALVAALDTIAESRAATQARRVETLHRIKRLQRLRQMQPDLQEIDDIERELVSLADTAALPDGFAAALSDRLDEREAARHALAQAQTRERDTSEALARIVVDPALLGDAGNITALFAQSADYTGKVRDLPRITAEESDYRDRIDRLRRTIGLSAGADTDSLQPSPVALARVEGLVAEGRELADTLKALDAGIKAERQTLEALQRSQQTAALVDPKPWRDRLAAIGPELKEIEPIAGLEKRHAALLRTTREAAARLVPPVDDLDRLAVCPLPSTETLLRHRNALAACDDRERETAARLGAATDELARIGRQIVELEDAGQIPSPEAIAAARAARDAAFARLRSRMPGGGAISGSIDADVTAYESRVADADRLADLCIADSQRATQHAAALLRRRALEAEIAALRAAGEAQARSRSDALALYRAEFAAAGIVPGAPADMDLWTQRVAVLLDERRSAAAILDDLSVLRATEAKLQPVLLEIAKGLALGDGGLPVQALARAIETRLAALADAWTEGRTTEGKRQEAARRLETLEAEHAAATGRHGDWTARFHAATAAIGLPGDVTPDEAGVAIAAWREYPDLVHERDNRARRVAGMKRDTDQFARSAQAFAETHAPDLRTLPAHLIVEALRNRLQKAEAEKVRQDETRSLHQTAQIELARARQRLEDASAALDALAANLPDHASLPDLLDRVRRRDALRQALATSRRRFATLSDGNDESVARADLDGFDRASAQVEIDGLEREDEALVARLNEDAAREAELVNQRRLHEASEGSELAALQRQSAEVEIVDVARHWAVLKLASTLLGAAMDRHRQSQSDPLLRRAGALFSTLTGGSFAGLAQVFGEDDQPELKGERASGERVSIGGMSDGTVDQLYLALRMAYLEDYATRNEPAPFIGDDIFQTFDDARTAAGLVALAQMAGSIQPILFTHQRSVVDVGRACLGSDLDLIEL